MNEAYLDYFLDWNLDRRAEMQLKEIGRNDRSGAGKEVSRSFR
jgi:hypothetical protein